MSESSIVENFFLTSPLFKEARQKEKINPDTPYHYPEEVAFSSAAPPQTEASNIEATLTKLLKEKYDPQMVDKMIEEAWRVHPGPSQVGPAYIIPYHLAKPAWVNPHPKVHEIPNVYIAFTFAERRLANPKHNGYRYDPLDEFGGTGAVTLLDKRMEGKYTQADTENLERIRKSEDLVSKHGLEGLYGGRKSRKSKKSKRAQKKHKTTRKSKLTRSR
jgi:hypothetical protein